MKKTFYLFLTGLFILWTPAFSQIQKGNILVGTDIANFDLGLRSGSVFQMTIDPKLAFFIKDDIAVGGYLDFNLQTVTGTTIINYGVGALARYYFPDKNNQNPLRHSSFFIEGNAGITGANVSGGSNTNGLGLGIGPGYTYFISPNVGLETLLKYNGIVGFGNATTQSDLSLNIGFQIYLPSRNLRTKLESDTR